MGFSKLNLHLVSLLLRTAASLTLPTYPGLRTDLSKAGVLEIGFNSTTSPINAWGQDFVSGLTDIVRRLQNNTEIKVLVFKSDIPQYFIPHLDILISPPGKATLGGLLAARSPFSLSAKRRLTMLDPTIVLRTVDLIYNITNLPQVSIGAVNGVARGGGNEFLTALDMRFATKAHARFGQPEVGSGIIPGAGGSQFLPGLIGRGRALEYILSSKDINAQDAERIGWINRAFDSEKEMNVYVDELATRIALFPLHAIHLAKQSINLRTKPTLAELQGDTDRYLLSTTFPITQALGPATAALINNQSPGTEELFLGDYLPELYKSSTVPA